MINVAFFISIIFAPALNAWSQQAASDQLSWNEFYKLQWYDFQGAPDKDSHGDAATAVSIKAKPFLVKNEINYDVVAIFNRSKSWVRDRSPSLLAHEQLHFDIAELYARKIRKKIRDLKANGVDDIKTYNAAIKALLQESNEVDIQYDIETLHGAMSKRQAAWAENVAEELARLERFKKVRRVIGG